MASQAINGNKIDGNLWITDNVGIGTETPNAQLHIDADVTEGKILVESGGNLFKLVVDGTGSTIGTVNAVPLVFKTDGSDRLTITPIGNIGIAQSNPGFKLDVNGIINATGFRRFPRIRLPISGLNQNIPFGSFGISFQPPLNFTHCLFG